MKLRGRAPKVASDHAGHLEVATRRRSSSSGDDDRAGEYPDGRQLAATSAEHIDADRAGWYQRASTRG